MNKITRGWVWESVENEPEHFYLILTDDEQIKLRHLSTGNIVYRYRGQITGYGIIRRPRKGE